MSEKACPKCGLQPPRYTSDHQGGGFFCNYLTTDKNTGERFCSVKAAEGQLATKCGYTEDDVKKHCCRLICTKNKRHLELLGRCQDFEPSRELRGKLLPAQEDLSATKMLLRRREERITRLAEALEMVIGSSCDCDTEVDRETGAMPDRRNILGFRIWGDECKFCMARRVLRDCKTP